MECEGVEVSREWAWKKEWTRVEGHAGTTHKFEVVIREEKRRDAMRGMDGVDGFMRREFYAVQRIYNEGNMSMNESTE